MIEEALTCLKMFAVTDWLLNQYMEMSDCCNLSALLAFLLFWFLGCFKGNYYYDSTFKVNNEDSILYYLKHPFSIRGEILTEAFLLHLSFVPYCLAGLCRHRNSKSLCSHWPAWTVSAGKAYKSPVSSSL